MATQEEFASQIMGTDVIREVMHSISTEAAQALREICRGHERTGQPVEDHFLPSGGYMGEMIVRALVLAELITEEPGDRRAVRAYAPTKKGAEFYKKLQEEGSFTRKR